MEYVTVTISGPPTGPLAICPRIRCRVEPIGQRTDSPVDGAAQLIDAEQGSQPERHQGRRAGGGGICTGRRAGGGGDCAVRRRRGVAHPTRLDTARGSVARSDRESGDSDGATQPGDRPCRALPRARRSDDPDDGRGIAATRSTRRDGQRGVRRRIVPSWCVPLGRLANRGSAPVAKKPPRGGSTPKKT